MEFKLVLSVRDFAGARYITFHVILYISSLQAALKEKEREREREIDAVRNKTVESFNCNFHELLRTYQSDAIIIFS